jgi:hypothetical protein
VSKLEVQNASQLTLNGGTIKDSLNNDAALTLPQYYENSLSFNQFIRLNPTQLLGNGDTAIDVLGQYTIDTNGAKPNFTQTTLNTAAGGTNPLGFNTPVAVELDTINQRLFVADSANNRVLVYNTDVNNNLVDRNPDYVLGQTGFFTAVSPVTSSTFSSISGLLYDGVGNRLFVSDGPANRVLVFDVDIITNGESATGVLGQADFTSSSAGTTQNSLSSPLHLAHDVTRNYLYVTDLNNNRVMVFNVVTVSNGENAINVIGQTNFTTATSGTTQNKFNQPNGVAYDNALQRLFV